MVNHGSKLYKFQSIALQIFRKCSRDGITLDLQWIPRDQNQTADVISKIVDYDYTINDDSFHFINHLWGPHTVDRFSCYYNKNLKRFNSRIFQPGTSVVNAFSFDLVLDNNWLSPVRFSYLYSSRPSENLLS